MREALGLLALNAGYAAAGLSVLVGLGLVRRLRDGFLLFGLAVITGWALTGIGVSLALMAGLHATIATVAVLWAVVAGMGAIAAIRVPRSPRSPIGERSLAGRVVALAFGAVAAAYLAIDLAAIHALRGAFEPDATSFWLPKALSIFGAGGLDTTPGGFTSFTHPGYPPLLPGTEAITLHFLGSSDPLTLGTQHWIIGVAFFWALGGLLSSRVRPAVLTPCLALLAFAPAFRGLIGTSLGDEALLLQFGVAAVAAAIWLVERDLRLLALASVFLTAGVLTKNEGLLLVVAVLVALAVAAGRRQFGWIVLAAVCPIGARLLWGAWLTANHVPPETDYRLGDLLRPGYLGEHSGRLWTGLDGLAAALLGPRWLLVVPFALAACVAAVVYRPRLVAFVVVAGTGVFLGYAAIYWISPLDIHFYIDSSARRIVSAVGVLCAGALPLLLMEGLRTGLLGTASLRRLLPARR